MSPSITIAERALQLVPDHSRIGLGSGRAAQAFVRALGERVRLGGLRVSGVPTSDETARLAGEQGIELVTLAQVDILDLTVDGADEVAPDLRPDQGRWRGSGPREDRGRVLTPLDYPGRR